MFSKTNVKTAVIVLVVVYLLGIAVKGGYAPNPFRAS